MSYADLNRPLPLPGFLNDDFEGPSGSRSRVLSIALLLSIIVPLLGALILEFRFDSWSFVNEPIHSSLEAAGGVIAIALVPLFILQRKYVKGSEYLHWAAGALLCTGILEVAHAFMYVSPGFSWARSLATSLGGILFSLVWLPARFSAKRSTSAYAWGVGVLSFLLAIFLFRESAVLPAMYKPDLTYLTSAKILNSLGGLGFLLASAFFISRFRQEKFWGDLLLANFCILSGLAGLFFGNSRMWDSSWWMFHILRMGSYAAIGFYFTNIFRRALSTAVQSNADLENSVAHRTRELAIANQGLRSEISQRKKIQEALQRSRAQHEATLQAINEGVTVFDRWGRIVFYNDAQNKIYDTGDMVVLNKGFDFLQGIYKIYSLEGEAVDVSQWPASRVLRGETLNGLECLVERISDHRKWYMHFSGQPIFNDKKEIILGLVVTRDITDVKKAELNLRDSENRLRQLADFMPQIVWATGANGINDFYNRRWWEYTGLPVDHQNKDLWEKIVHPSDLPRMLRHWEECSKSGNSFQLEYRLKSADGQYRWFLGRAVPVRNQDGEIIRWFGTSTDIHDHKVLLERIKESEQRLSLALASAEIGIWDWDLITDKVNASFVHSPLSELNPMLENISFDLFLTRVYEEDRATVLKLTKDAIEKKKEYAAEFRVRDPRGKIHWLDARGRLAFDESGEPVRMYGVDIDITERKEVERQLKEAVAQANEANELKSAFLANMSHEIRTPLGVIVGFTELLRDPEISEEERERSYEIMQRNGKQLTNLINDILDLSKIEAGQVQVEILRTNIRDLGQEVITLLEAKAQEKNLQLSLMIEPDVPEIVGTDPTRLKQVLINVVGNAIKFTDEGSVKLHVLRGQGRQLRFSVQDTGIGLTKDQQAKLFRPFSQADQSTTRKFGGTGLGLALSKKLSQALGGDLAIVASSPGQGSIFEATIENRPLLAEAEHPEPHEELEGLKILVVDDSPDNRELFAHLLSDHHARVETSENGQLALQRVLQENFDCVLMDIQMPVMDGFRATEELRRLGFQKPIIALTVYSMNEVQVRCQQVGCTDQISKPLKPTELIEVISRYTHVA